MAIWYVDYVNGLDANAGTSWATALKTLNGATSGKGVASGDTVRIAKSPDPTTLSQNATWTDLSKTVTLTTAVTLNIDLCESAWTAASTATVTADGTVWKQGTNSAKVSWPSSTVANTLYAYHALGSAINFSSYQQISFWFRASVSLVSALNLRICLCSDTAGATIVNSAALPIIPSANQWIPITIDFGSALGSSIQSVALYSGSVTTTNNIIYIDNIIACKASSAADSLSLTSLISKNTGSEAWFPIQSINGTTVMIDNGPNTLGNSGRGYSGVTETVTTWKRETIKTAMAAAAGTVVQSPGKGGVLGSNVIYDAGYNVSNSTQDGETFYDGLSGFGYAIQTIDYVTLNRMSLARYGRGYYVTSGANVVITAHTICGLQATSAIQINIPTTSPNNFRASITNIVNSADGVNCSTPVANGIFTVVNLNSNTGNGFTISGTGSTFNITNCKNNNNGFSLTVASGVNLVVGTSFAGNSGFSMNGGIYHTTILRGCTFSDTTDANTGNAFNERFQIANYNNTGVSKVYSDNLTIVSDTSTVHTGGGQSWKLSVTSANRSATYPGDLTVCSVYCQANVAVTITGWFRRDNTGVTASLVARGGQLVGIPSDVSSSMSAAANTWQQLSITATPTEAGVLNVQAWAYGGTTYNVWVTEVVPA